MKKILFILCALLAGVSGAWAEDVTYYSPKNRVTTFSSEKVYMIYNTCIDGNQDRTGFIFVDGDANMKKYTGSTDRNPKQFRTRNNAYLWKVVTGADNHVSIQNVSNSKYYGYDLSNNASDPENLYLYQWGELTSGQASANSQNEDDPSTKTANASITFATNKVFILGNGSNTYWNGDVGNIVTWSNGHPFAFYEVEEVTVSVTVPSGSNTYVDTKTIGTTEWKTQSNWALTDAWNSNGPGCPSSDMWSPIYLKDIASGTVPALEGWTFRMTADHSTFTIERVGKIQSDCYLTLKNTSVVTMNFGTGQQNPFTVNLNEGTGNILNFALPSTNYGSSITINYGSVSKNTNRVFNASASSDRTISTLNLNATLTDPTEKNTVESITLATFSKITVSTLTPTISGTDGWTSVANKAALDEQTADGKYYYVEQNSSGVTLNTYQFQVVSKKQQAKDKVSPYEDYIGTGVGKYTVYIGETAYSSYSAFETAVDGWTTIGACVEPTIAINQPTAGFYRFKAAARSADDKTYNWYMGGNAEGIYSASTTDPQASDANTIFYVEKDGDGYHPINYVSGLYSNGTANNAVGTKSNFTLTQAIKENNTDVLYGEYKLVNTGTSKVIVMWSNATLNAINGNNDWSGWTIEPVTSLPVTITTAKYASFCAPVAVTIPSGVTAYRAKSVGGDEITLSSIDDGIIPANTGVILYANVAEATTYNFDITTGGTAESLLAGTTAAVSRPSNSYVLSGGDFGVGFYKDGATTIPGFKAYYQGAGVKGYSFRFDDETEVKSLNELPLISEGEMYDLSGRQIKKPTRGLYLSKGQKVIVQ